MLKGHVSIGGGEQRVVSPEANVSPRLDARASLPHDDMTGADLLTAILLDAQILGVALSPVT
jgi:hypothetical protein